MKKDSFEKKLSVCVYVIAISSLDGFFFFFFAFEVFWNRIILDSVLKREKTESKKKTRVDKQNERKICVYVLNHL